MPDTSAIARRSTRSSSSYPSGNERGMISIAPWSNSASTAHRAITSSLVARLLGTGSPLWAWWRSICDVLKPAAPSRMAWRTSSCIATISVSVAARVCASSPITYRRTAECPTYAAALTPMRPSRLSRKSPKLPPRKSTPAWSASTDMPSTRDSISSSQAASPSRAGATVNPQLPITTVVTPCHDAGDAVGSKCSCAS